MKASDHQTEEGVAAPAQCTCQCGGKAGAPGGCDTAQPRKNALRSFLDRFTKSKPDDAGDVGLNMSDIDWMLSRHKDKGRGLIELMQDVSEHFGYLPPDALRHISITLDVPLTRLYAIATFYQDFKLTPQGKHRLVICTGTACHVKGAAAIVDVLCRELNIKPGETTADGKLTLSTVNCIGLCGVGPVAIMDGEYQSQLTADKALQMVKAL
ncbi:MAG TPA: NAD(P)H-dependent oxidoreductase subunit E [Verrucomicrobia bacterium]|nr:NAD(P)H-dependent oxidoreductase subunit E [Verrucomicrobiota bacterium]